MTLFEIAFIKRHTLTEMDEGAQPESLVGDSIRSVLARDRDDAIVLVTTDLIGEGLDVTGDITIIARPFKP